MPFQIDENDLDKLIVVGDRLLIKPSKNNERTPAGLYLPPGVEEKEPIHSGYVLKAGPGYPIPAISDSDEPWKETKDEVKYVPLQPREGDMAVYLKGSSYDIEFKNETYVIVPQSAILLLVRDEGLFD